MYYGDDGVLHRMCISIHHHIPSHDITGLSKDIILDIVRAEIDDILPKNCNNMGQLRKYVQRMKSMMLSDTSEPTEEVYSLDSDSDDDIIITGSSSRSSSSSSNSSNINQIPCQSMLNSTFANDHDWSGQVLEMLDRGFDLSEPYLRKVVRNIRVGSLTKLWKGNKFKFPIQNSINAVGEIT